MSARIGQGRLDEPIRVRGKDEIALLARTMEGMRGDLAGRERDLKTMLAGVAHEIRNPLGGIALFTGLLSREVADRPAARSLADRISNEVQVLKRIVDGFLEFAKPEEPMKEDLAAGPLLRDALALLAGTVSERPVAFVVDPALEAVFLRVDPVHFKRIALNILRNAVQAMPRGGTVRVQGSLTANRVRLCFADTGSGIPDSIRGNLYKPFFTTREKGTGLGLSIVRKLAELNGGTVELARSGPDGTEFCLTLERGHRS
jgi:signal transduction histidine kinase